MSLSNQPETQQTGAMNDKNSDLSRGDVTVTSYVVNRQRVWSICQWSQLIFSSASSPSPSPRAVAAAGARKDAGMTTNQDAG